MFRCSTTELRQLFLPPAGVEPATVGLVEVSRAFTTPQTFQSFFFTSLLLHFALHTPLALRFRHASWRQKFREESAPTGFRDSNPKPCGSSKRRNRELHHPGTLLPQRMLFNRNDLGDFIYGRANKQTARPVRLTIDPSWLL